MRIIRFCFWTSFVVLLLALTAALLVTDPLPMRAQVGTPPSSTIQQQFGPIGLGLRSGGRRDGDKRGHTGYLSAGLVR